MKTSFVLACCIVLASLLAVSCGQESVAPDSPAMPGLGMSAAEQGWVEAEFCFTEQEPAGQFFIDCLGEEVKFYGCFTLKYHIVETAPGVFNGHQLWDPSTPNSDDYVAQGVTSGKIFHYALGHPISWSLHVVPGEVNTYIQREEYRADDGSRLIIFGEWRYTVDANGELRTYRNNLYTTFQCR